MLSSTSIIASLHSTYLSSLHHSLCLLRISLRRYVDQAARTLVVILRTSDDFLFDEGKVRHGKHRVPTIHELWLRSRGQPEHKRVYFTRCQVEDHLAVEVLVVESSR